MHWYYHLLIHYLDLIRHETISTVAWEPVKTNIGAGVWWAIIVAVATGVVYPRMRKTVEFFVKSHIEEANKDIHKKIDHIIKNDPNIPDLD
jgi:hypothetical protein